MQQKISGTISMSGYSNGLGTLEIIQYWSSSQSEPPTLNMTAEIKMRPYNQQGQQQPVFRPVSLLRIAGEFRSPEHRVLVRFQTDEPLYAHDPSYDAVTQVTFEIPMDLLTIHRIEVERNGANLRAELKLQIIISLYG